MPAKMNGLIRVGVRVPVGEENGIIIF